MMDSPRLRGAVRRRFVRPVPSLRELAAAHAPLLVLDAASARVQAGLWRADGTSEWRTSDAEASVGVFRCVQELNVPVADIRGFVFCEGPGSILGVRTVAMAVRTWQVLAPRPAFAYSSLALVAHALRRPQTAIIADARRDSWHSFRLGGTLERVPSATLGGELLMPENFRHWSPLPPGVQQTPYDVQELLRAVANADLFRATDAPDAFLHEEPSYATWTPQVHRAP